LSLGVREYQFSESKVEHPVDPLRRCIKEPIPEIFAAADLLARAVASHVESRFSEAESLFRRANMKEVHDWTNSAWINAAQFVLFKEPDGDTATVPEAFRCHPRHPARQTKAAVLVRDGFRCRYCGLPVVDPLIRKIAHRLYPDAVPWNWRDIWKQHAAFQCLWLQYDHVVPHSHGGSSDPDNIVITCAVCNFAKDRFTLRQLGLADPRDRAPMPTDWDGLQSLSAFRGVLRDQRVATPPNTSLDQR
jgi:hypothetical protein